MKTGTICYAVESGLGIQAKSFIDHGIIDKILIWPHSTYKPQKWYKKSQIASSVDELLDTCDRLFFFETPFDWSVVRKARERGIKTILMLMYEFTPWPMPYFPDVLVGGSLAEVETCKQLGFKAPCRHINAPVEAKWRQRHYAKVFIHNAGHGGLKGRNGTKELLEAMKYVKSRVKLIVRTQNGGLECDDPRVEIVNHAVPYDELWSVGDMLVFPEKFGGSFLPMQEAFASGMPVMATNRFPTNTWLPWDLLIPTDGFEMVGFGNLQIEFAKLNPKKIAAKIDEWYGQDISAYSLMGKEWAKHNSWEVSGPKFKTL
jgi:hypothetical protein